MKITASRPNAVALLHGAAWRAASLLSRVAFLALIVPRTVPNEFGIFFSYSSIALLLSRVISVGAIDNLPTKIKGQPEVMRSACRDLAPFAAVAAGVTAIAVVTDSLPMAALGLALCMASGLALAGAVRSVSPAWFERWLNLHPIVFFALALLIGDWIDAKDLLLCQSVALLASQAAMLRAAMAVLHISREPKQEGWPRRVVALLKGGQTRMISDTLVVACIRAVAIGPLLLGAGAISDSLALALALGEVAWTVGMILVHRNFAFYCGAEPDLRHSLRSAIALLLAICAAGLVAKGLAWVAHAVPFVQRVEPTMLLAALVFFAGITALSEFRYYDMAIGKRLAPWIGGQAAFVIAVASGAEWLNESQSIWAVAAVTMLISVWLIAHRALHLSRNLGSTR